MGVYKLNFGQYKGRLVRECPPSYIVYLATHNMIMKPVKKPRFVVPGEAEKEARKELIKLLKEK